MKNECAYMLSKICFPLNQVWASRLLLALWYTMRLACFFTELDRSSDGFVGAHRRAIYWFVQSWQCDSLMSIICCIFTYISSHFYFFPSFNSFSLPRNCLYFFAHPPFIYYTEKLFVTSLTSSLFIIYLYVPLFDRCVVRRTCYLWDWK